jgi:homospermidine synthase
VSHWVKHALLDVAQFCLLESTIPYDHERHWPADACQYIRGSPAAIYLKRPGASTRVRSWTPLAGPQQAFLITHGESRSRSLID